jgi:allophanate hydrolase subunit 2
VLLMDCQTLGGYPKLATIVTADLPRFTQTRPGRHVTFAAVDIATAHGLYREHQTRLAELKHLLHDVPEAPARRLPSHW